MTDEAGGARGTPPRGASAAREHGGERSDRTRFISHTLTTTDFQYGGQRTYKASIDYAESCVWHYNQTPEDIGDCADESIWPQGSAWPDYFMLGDPHNNYYEGVVYYDDIQLEVWRE